MRKTGRPLVVAAALSPLATAAAAQQVVREDVPGIRNYARVESTVACAGAITVEAIPQITDVAHQTRRVDGWDIDRAREEAKLLGLNNAALERFALDEIAKRKPAGR